MLDTEKVYYKRNTIKPQKSLLKSCVRCRRTVKKPQINCWKEYGLCPACFGQAKLPPGINLNIPKSGIECRKMNPVDLYWDTLTLKFLISEETKYGPGVVTCH